MLLYEVNLSIDQEIYSAYKAWLLPHMEQMLGFQGFISADLWEENENNSSSRKLIATYKVDTQENLNRYFDNHAEAMRQDGMDRFGNHFKASRRVLVLQKAFNDTKN